MKDQHRPNAEFPHAKNGHLEVGACVPRETAFGHPMDFLGNRFVYVVVSPRARGLSIGVNMNPDKKCNFDCVYCEVNRRVAARENRLDVKVMVAELEKTLALIQAGRLRERPWYCTLPEELLQLRHVTLSGDGEPTLAPNFAEAVEAVFHVRAVGRWPFFKLVLVTNATGLDQPQVQEGLSWFAAADEIWAKLDGGTQAYLNWVNRPDVRLEKILERILVLARRRPVVIQSLFPAINGMEPPGEGDFIQAKSPHLIVRVAICFDVGIIVAGNLKQAHRADSPSSARCCTAVVNYFNVRAGRAGSLKLFS